MQATVQYAVLYPPQSSKITGKSHSPVLTRDKSLETGSLLPTAFPATHQVGPEGAGGEGRMTRPLPGSLL